MAVMRELLSNLARNQKMTVTVHLFDISWGRGEALNSAQTITHCYFQDYGNCLAAPLQGLAILRQA